MRVGPERAGAIKSLARRWREQTGITFRALSAKLVETQGVYVAPASLRQWSIRDGWAIPAPPPTPSKRPRGPTKRQAATDVTGCRRRCPTCLKPIEPGETHVCQISARAIIFCGGYL